MNLTHNSNFTHSIKLPLASWHKGLDLRYQWLSKEWATLLTEQAPECHNAGDIPHLIGRSDSELLPIWLNEHLLHDDFAVLAHETVQTSDTKWVFSDGCEHTLRITRKPTYNDNNELCGICGFAIDVSTEYQLKQELQQQSSQQSNWLHALQSHTLIANMNRLGQLTYISASLSRLIGREQEDVVGLLRENSPLRLRGGSINHYLSLAEQGDPVVIECSGRAPDGHRYWLRSLVIALHSPSSLEQCFLELFTDLTPEKMAAVELENVNTKLVQVHNENTQLISKLEVAAHTDPLTGLANRRALFERAKQEQERSQRQNTDLSLLALDIDHFKSINDQYGHEAGDSALKSMAAWSQKMLRNIDLLARTGGEEFIVLLPDTCTEQAMIAAERLRSFIEKNTVAISKEEHIRFTVSFGLVQIERCETFDHALARADKALYQAKASGRNCIREG